jgi:hypothetical protein
MNRRLFTALPLAAACLLPAEAAAQTGPPPALKPPPERGAWTVRYKTEKEKEKPKPAAATDDVMVDVSAAAPEIRKVEYVTNGKVARRVTYYSDRTTITAFILDSLGVEENPANPKQLVIGDFNSPWMAGGDFLRRYPGLEWVKPQFYRGVVKLDEIPCHHFVEGEARPAPPSDADDVMPVDPSEMRLGGREAWITADGRPLATKHGNVSTTFTFKPADEVPVIEIPERFRAKVQRYLEALAPKNLQ